jgi:hypothetical protein
VRSIQNNADKQRLRMTRSQKQPWEVGDVFLVPTSDGQFVIGQIIGREAQVLNSVTVAFFDQRVPSPQEPTELDWRRIFSVVFATREQLDRGSWKVVSRRSVTVPKDLFPYEGLRTSGFVGAKVIGSGILNEFVDAYYGLVPWDNWKDPNYLDGLLVAPDKKPIDRIVLKGGK